MRFKLIALVALLSPAVASAQSSIIERIQTTQIVNMAFRADALPFSFKDANGQPAGYTVELCKRVAASMASHLNVPGLKVHRIGSTSRIRFELIEKRAADMECGATTATLKRRFVDAKVVAYPSREAARPWSPRSKPTKPTRSRATRSCSKASPAR